MYALLEWIDIDTGQRKRSRLNSEEIQDLELMERLDVEGRRIYDPLNKIFDHEKKRATDMPENSNTTIPKPCDALTESLIESLGNKIMETFRRYRNKNCKGIEDQETNLTKAEQRGL